MQITYEVYIIVCLIKMYVQINKILHTLFDKDKRKLKVNAKKTKATVVRKDLKNKS